MNSLDLVEAVVITEEFFGVEIPDLEIASPAEMVDWLERNLSNSRPNKRAAALLKKLATTHGRPELAEGLNGTWRRAQIAAIISEIFR